MREKRQHTEITKFLLILMVLVLLLSACSSSTVYLTASATEQAAEEPELTSQDDTADTLSEESEAAEIITLDNIPDWADSPYVELNGNVPEFSEDSLTTVSFETYSDLDELGRCGVAYACIGTDLMPTEERGSIGQIRPSGWHTVTYDIIDGRYLYNRCHLIGYQLSGENANEKNLITGTRYLNVEGMLPFENMVADYVQETDNHVLYRVTPVYEGDNLIASGVQMEALSVEDNGESIEFNVYVYNVQPGIEIDYATGESQLSETAGTAETADTDEVPDSTEGTWVLNTNTMRFHNPDCSSVSKILDSNRQNYTGSRETLIEMGYVACGICKP